MVSFLSIRVFGLCKTLFLNELSVGDLGCDVDLDDSGDFRVDLPSEDDMLLALPRFIRSTFFSIAPTESPLLLDEGGLRNSSERVPSCDLGLGGAGFVALRGAEAEGLSELFDDECDALSK